MLRGVFRLLDRLPGDFRAVFTEDAAATGAEAVRAGVAGDGGAGGQRGVQADLVLADFAPLLRDRLAAWTLPVRGCRHRRAEMLSLASACGISFDSRSFRVGRQPTVFLDVQPADLALQRWKRATRCTAIGRPQHALR